MAYKMQTNRFNDLHRTLEYVQKYMYDVCCNLNCKEIEEFVYAVRALQDNENVLVRVPVGSSDLRKSQFYILPTLLKDVKVRRSKMHTAAVISPSQSVMHEIVKEITSRGVSALILNSKTELLSYPEVAVVSVMFIAVEFATSDLAKNVLTSKMKPSLLVFDSAERLSQYSEDYDPGYRDVAVRLTKDLPCPALALSASPKEEVHSDICCTLNLSDYINIHTTLWMKESSMATGTDVEVAGTDRPWLWEYKGQEQDHPQLISMLSDPSLEEITLPELPARMACLVLSSEEPGVKTEISVTSDTIVLSDMSIPVRLLRYVVPVANPSGELRNLDPYILLCSQTGENLSSQVTCFQPEGGAKSLLIILNLIRQVMFELILPLTNGIPEMAVKVLDYNRILYDEVMDCHVSSVPDCTSFVVRVDMESMSFYKNKFDKQPCCKLLFWKEAGHDVIEKVTLLHGDHRIRFETLTDTIIVKNNEEETKFRRVISSNKSKPKDIFTDIHKLVQYILENERINPQPSTQRSSLCEEYRAYPAEASSYISGHSAAASGFKSAGDEQQEAARDMSISLDNAEDICKQSPEFESINLQWIVAENEILDIIEKGIVPPSDFSSAGFDPHTFDHFKKCLDDLEEKLMIDQSYDVAVSHVQGMKEIFSESRNRYIRQILHNSDTDLLKKVYFRNWSG